MYINVKRLKVLYLPYVICIIYSMYLSVYLFVLQTQQSISHRYRIINACTVLYDQYCTIEILVFHAWWITWCIYIFLWFLCEVMINIWGLVKWYPTIELLLAHGLVRKHCWSPYLLILTVIFVITTFICNSIPPHILQF